MAESILGEQGTGNREQGTGKRQEARGKSPGVADSGYGFAPLAPQMWGEQDFQSPPHLGDLGGLNKTR